MANLMKFGKKILHIVILVLVKIYQGLNKIAHSTHASSYNACFLVHYVHGWLNHYFETHFLTPKKVTRHLKVRFFEDGGAKYFDENAVQELTTTKHHGTPTFSRRTKL